MSDAENSETIQVEQAVFASSERGAVKGYQLVSQSPGIDRESSQVLCRWAPTQLRGSSPHQWTVNCFPISDELFAVTRTVLGGPEYSSRGASQVVTLILVIGETHFASYSHNAMAVVKTALAMGYLRLPWEATSGPIQPANLPRRPIVDTSAVAGRSDEPSRYQPLLEKLTALINEPRRVAVVGSTHPLEVIDLLLPKLEIDIRRKLSFTTGLAPAAARPFQVHFLDKVDTAMRRTLDSQGIVSLDA